jgi:cation diffusion facilitator CzcD-associated flavoprotein CzcO
MAEPAVLPLRSPMSFAAGTRENILGTWDSELAKHGVNIRYQSEVKSIVGERGAFTITLTNGTTLGAGAVILAIGVQGNIRKLGAPGEDLPMVQYQLDDPGAFSDETVVVVGAGDAAIENALRTCGAGRKLGGGINSRRVGVSGAICRQYPAGHRSHRLPSGHRASWRDAAAQAG